MKTPAIRAAFAVVVLAAPHAWTQTAGEHFERGNALVEQKRPKDAIPEFLRALAVQPDFAPAMRALGFARQSLGDIAGSLRDFDRYLALAPADAIALNARCWLRTEAGDLDGAMADCNLSIRRDPENSMPLINRGRILSRRGDNQGALADYSKAIQLDPGSGMAYRNRGLVRKKLGDLDGAQRDFEKAIEVEPGYTRARDSLELLKTERAAASNHPTPRVTSGASLPSPPSMDSNDGASPKVQESVGAPPPGPMSLPPPPPIEADAPGSRPTVDPAPIDEALTLGRIRAVLSAQETFHSIHGLFTREIRCLVEPPLCRQSTSTSEGLLDRAFLQPERSGYRFSIYAPEASGSPSDASAVIAMPSSRDGARRTLCGHVTKSGDRFLCTLPASMPVRVDQGRCPSYCEPIR